MLTVRPATPEDIATICAVDPLAQHDPERAAFIARSVEAGQCHLMLATAPVGYAILDYSFFGQGFVALLYVHPAYRRHGAGSQLMHYLTTVCRTPKLFTSTNLSNLAMQALLAAQGFQLSGVIHNLDENDPELVYVKFIQPVMPGETETFSWKPTLE